MILICFPETNETLDRCECLTHHRVYNKVMEDYFSKRESLDQILSEVSKDVYLHKSRGEVDAFKALLKFHSYEKAIKIMNSKP